ncbi:MAG: hypothetical protein JXB62_02445 [Pirellulales bacterium]|nr:hypothetical protein [Pirellulales bacterium]
MNRLVLGLAAVFVAANVGVVNAAIGFGDTSKYWAGWNNGSGDDARDVIGTPDFLNDAAGGVDLGANGLLQKITFSYNSAAACSPELLYGDLFLGVDGDSQWDYVVRTHVFGGGDQRAAMAQTNIALCIYDYSAAPIALGSPTAYQYSSQARRRAGGSWTGYNIRDWHPWALAAPDADKLMAGNVVFSGWQDYANPGVSFFDFTSLPGGGLDLSGASTLTIGFAMQCGNDVIHETVDLPKGNVPEPASLIVWSLLAVVGLLVVRHRRRGAA